MCIAIVDDVIGKITDDINIKTKPKQVKPQNELPKVKCPARGSEPVSEFERGFLTRAFPHLFPDGKGDISNIRKGKTPKMTDYAKHLYRLNRNFAADPTFTLVLCNMLQRHQAISTGNVYAKRVLKDMTVGELKQKIAEKDGKTLNGLLYFGSSIRGSAQFFKKEQMKAFHMIRHLRISSKDKNVMNLFLTFSAADMQWDHMHEFFEGSEKYLYKKIVKSKKDIPADADPTDYITEAEDYKLRQDAVAKNADICNFYFRNQLDLLFENVLVPCYGVTDYFIRYEFQHRGSIHSHMVVLAENGPTAQDMKESLRKEGIEVNEDEPLSENDYFEFDEEETVFCPETNKQEKRMKRMKRSFSKDTLDAREKMIRFAVETIGITATHINPDPKQWPAPYGQNIYKPKENVMRQQFHIPKSDKKFNEKYEKIINRCMMHNCRNGYCMKADTAKAKKKKRKQTKEAEVAQKAICRFNFPLEYHGFQPVTTKIDDKTEILDEFIELTEDLVGPLERKDILCGKKRPFLGASYVYDKIKKPTALL